MTPVLRMVKRSGRATQRTAITSDLGPGLHDIGEFGFELGGRLRLRHAHPLRCPAAQLKQFLDSASSLWHEGKLADKPVTTFVSSAAQHGGQEATILSLNNVFYHWGCVIVPLGYTDDIVYAAGGNPYGTSWPAGFPSTMPDETTLDCARYQGRRLAHFAEVLTAARAEPAATSA